jgi:hypothetical protein
MRENNIVIFEAKGGSDKGPDGHRKDTMPIIDALKAKGWNAAVIYYSDDRKDELFEYVKNNSIGYVSRINPGNLANGEKMYHDMLRALCAEGLIGFPHPDAMINFGAKDALVKLRNTDLVPEDTYAYYTIEQFRDTFPASISHGVRVLKQNRGSTGEGIWRVELIDERYLGMEAGEEIPLDAKIKCTEAVDNHVEYHSLSNFMTFCTQYVVGENGMLVDMRFMPRIKEGEIRILMVGAEPVFVVHKKPADAEDAFSATLYSGAKYTYDSPEKWKELVDSFIESLPEISNKLGDYEIPLIWTADFMLDWDEHKNDIYVLGEINCSCVGFTSHLDMGIQEKVADEIIRVVNSHSLV